jgi:excisionase family DNA binding protein
MPMAERDQAQWLSLSEASELLGVHPSTLRRWADAGTIPYTRTPGGHRRFRRADLERILRAEEKPEPLSAEPSIVPVPEEELDEEALMHQEWHIPFVEADKVQRMRVLGQRLLGLLLQFLTRPEEEARFLAEGQQVGYDYGHEAYVANISLLDSVRAFLYFRTMAAHKASEMPVETRDSMWLQRRVDRFLNAVLLGLIAAYEEARGYATEDRAA